MKSAVHLKLDIFGLIFLLNMLLLDENLSSLCKLIVNGSQTLRGT